MIVELYKNRSTMKKPVTLPLCLLKFLALSFVCLPQAMSETSEWMCRYCATHASYASLDQPPSGRFYAPDRLIDVVHQKLDVTPDFDRRTVSGRVEITFKPIAKSLQEVRFDAHRIVVTKVTSSHDIRSYQNTDEAIEVLFERALEPNVEVKVTIHYSAEPKEKGLYFRTEAMGYPKGDDHIFTQGEMHEARHWYPCYDFPNEKFTTEMICHVPKGMIALSNGRLVEGPVDSGDGLVSFHWLQDKPHVNYLVALAAGHLKKVEDTVNGVPLAFYTPPSEFKHAAAAFEETKAMMEFFEEVNGVPYPWDRYDQVCVHDFPFGGMENTTLTILTMNTLFSPESESLRFRGNEDLVAHELAHQWFGDLLTTKDWSHIWLNEGFATYAEHQWAGFRHGQDEKLWSLYKDGQSVLNNKNDKIPMVWRGFKNPIEQFSFRAYPKGSWILHMLHSELGDELFRKVIKTYVERHKFGNVVTENLNTVLEELSGRSFDRFFDQWVFHAGTPQLDVSYSFDQKTKLAKIDVTQKQPVNDKSLLFHLPLTIRFQVGSHAVDKHVSVTRKSETFYLPLEEKPSSVRIDPDLSLLATINFTPPFDMLKVQLMDEKDMIGRLLAVKALAKRKDQESVAFLKKVLASDGFYAVRIEASKSLRAIGTEEAYTALKLSRQQEDARVRSQVVRDIASIYSLEALDELKAILRTEENPTIVATALRGAVGYGDETILAAIQRNLNTPSHRDILASAAIEALKSMETPAVLDELRNYLGQSSDGIANRLKVSVLDALGHLGAYLDEGETRQDLRSQITRYLDDPYQRVQRSAIRALGELGDPRAIRVLSKFTQGDSDDPLKKAADQSISKLRSKQPAQKNVSQLRSKVEELRRANERLEERFDDLSKRFEAFGEAKE